MWRSDSFNTIALAVMLAVAGCVEVTPIGPGPNPLPPGPGPAPLPTPDTPLRRAVAESLADVPRDECIKLYGAFTALADYVQAGSKGVDSTGQLLQLTTKTLDNLDWAKGKYQRLSDVVRSGLNERFKVPRKIDEVRADVAGTFREIAAGCRDAAVRK